MARVVTQQIIICVIVATIIIILFITAWPYLVQLLPDLKTIPELGVVLVAVAMMPTTMWSLAVDLMTLDGRAKLFAIIVMTQSILSVGALMITLFWFHADVNALFISNAIGAAVLGIGACIALWRYLTWPEFSGTNTGVADGAATITFANGFEMIYPLVERNLLAGNVGLASLGLHTHAQQYRAVVFVAIKALTRAIWPVTLEESQEKKLKFCRTRAHWNMAYFLVGTVGIIFATHGSDVIGLITHGKFTGAGPYAAAGIAYLLLQNMGKPATGILNATGQAIAFAKYNIGAGFLGLVVTVVAIPAIGVWGAILAAFTHQLCLRIAIQILVSSNAKVPFQDQWAIAEFALISAILVLLSTVDMSLGVRSVFLVFVLLSNMIIFLWIESPIAELEGGFKNL
jgi:O-antigen/teichoic acid export membrane protein